MAMTFSLLLWEMGGHAQPPFTLKPALPDRLLSPSHCCPGTKSHPSDFGGHGLVSGVLTSCVPAALRWKDWDAVHPVARAGNIGVRLYEAR